MATFYISPEYLQVCFLIFLRVSAILISIPIFDSRNIPVMFKAGLSIAVTIVLFPVLKLSNAPFLMPPIPFAIGVLGEIILGLIIGLSVRLIFAGIQLAGQLAGFQMGLAIANVMDPISSMQASVVAQFYNLAGMLCFLAINAHHWFIKAIAESFRLVPPFGFQFTNSLMDQIMRLSGNMFVIAIKVGAPLIAALLITSVALGLIVRTVPQMNIFIVAMPLKIFIGMVFLVFSLPYLAEFFRAIFSGLGNDILLLLKAV